MTYILPAEQVQSAASPPQGGGLKRNSATFANGLSSVQSLPAPLQRVGRTSSTPLNLHHQGGDPGNNEEAEPPLFIAVGPSRGGGTEEVNHNSPPRAPSITAGLCDLSKGSIAGGSPRWRSGFAKPQREKHPECGSPLDLFRWMTFVLRFSEDDIDALRCCKGALSTNAIAEEIYARLLEVKAIRRLLGLDSEEVRTSRHGMLAKYVSWILHLESAPCRDYAEALNNVAAVHKPPRMKTPIPREYLLSALGVMQETLMSHVFEKVEGEKVRPALMAIGKLMWIQAAFFTKSPPNAEKEHEKPREGFFELSRKSRSFALWFLGGLLAVKGARFVAYRRGAGTRVCFMAEMLAALVVVFLKSREGGGGLGAAFALPAASCPMRPS